MTTRAPTHAIRNFRAALACYLRVPAALTKYRLWGYQLLPALFSLLFTTAAIIAMFRLSGTASSWAEARWGGWTSLAVAVGVFLVMAVMFLFLHKRVVLIALAPFLSRIAEKITRAEYGPQTGPPMTKWQAFGRSTTINLRSAIIELALTLPLVIAGFFLFISPFTSLAILLISSRYAGNGLMDFPLEYRGLSVRESIAWSRRHKASAVGIGLGYQVFLMVPVLGWMFAPTFATVAGTLLAIEKDRQNPDGDDPQL